MLVMSRPPSRSFSHRSAFDQGKVAGARPSDDSDAVNPFAAGSADHRNFELGRRIGAAGAEERRHYSATTPNASLPDTDEIDD